VLVLDLEEDPEEAEEEEGEGEDGEGDKSMCDD
jgi:hypothetical protein